jgi:hypothetical protein
MSGRLFVRQLLLPCSQGPGIQVLPCWHVWPLRPTELFGISMPDADLLQLLQAR